jgi:hypothetical protein
MVPERRKALMAVRTVMAHTTDCLRFMVKYRWSNTWLCYKLCKYKLADSTDRTVWLILSTFRRLLVTSSVVPSSTILVTLMMEALSSFDTPVLTRVTRLNIPQDATLHSHRRENLKSYIALTGWNL